MTKLEIIDETVKFYSEDTSRRAVEKHSCEYLTTDGRMCAVGRCAENPGDIMFGSLGCGDGVWSTVKFKPQYQGHCEDFWDGLQILHDTCSYWDSDGLTEKGEEYLVRLKRRWADL